MKKITLLVFLIVSLAIAGEVWARFESGAKLMGLQFRVADFVAPPVPQFIDLLESYGPVLAQIKWLPVVDYGGKVGAVNYRLQLDGDLYGTSENFYQFDFSLLTVGQHRLQIKACDALYNCSSWSEPRNFMVGGLVSNSAPHLFNGDYKVREAVTDGWSSGGAASQVDSVWTLGGPELTHFWWENFISQTLANDSPLGVLSFEYEVDSEEVLSEFDLWALVLMINEKIVWRAPYGIATGWHKAYVDLSQFSASELTVKFFAGGSGDENLATWARLKSISTKSVVIADKSDLGLRTKDGVSRTGDLIWSDSAVSYLGGENGSELFFFPYSLDEINPSLIVEPQDIAAGGENDCYFDLKIEDDFGIKSWVVVNGVGSTVPFSVMSGGVILENAIVGSEIDLSVRVDLSGLDPGAGLKLVASDLVGHMVEQEVCSRLL